MAKANVKDLLEAGVHFGHMTRKWNPNMAPYIFMAVSYTHLDVYKRQISYRNVFGKIFVRFDF